MLNETDFLNELYETIIEEEIKELGIEVKEGFSITNKDQANFFLRRLAEIKEEANEIITSCDNEITKFIEKVNSFRDKKIQSLASLEEYFTGLLKQYAESELKGTAKKSIKLPFGTLQFKNNPQKYIYENESDLLKYLQENKDMFKKYIRVKEELNKVDIKKDSIIKENKLYINEVEVPLVKVEDGGISFTCKLT